MPTHRMRFVSTHIRLQRIPNGRHRRRGHTATIGCIVVVLQAVAQLRHQDPSESAAEHKDQGADNELAQEQQHDQHKVLANRFEYDRTFTTNTR